MKKSLLLSLSTAIILSADSEIDLLKQQIAMQKKALELLQEKVAKMEQADEKRAKIDIETKMAQSQHDVSSSFSQAAYTPDISLIINSSVVSRNVKNSEFTNMEMPGFFGVGDAELPFNANRGFNLNYAEFGIHSTIDPYFDAFAIFHLHPSAFEIEEAYVNTRALPYGLKVKAGKFKSGFGRINAKHQHAWNFSQQPLINKALFGPDGINDAGVSLQWVAPTDFYLMTGLEAMQGQNDRSFGDVEENNLYIGYLKSSVDIGEDFSILGGVNVAHGTNTDLKSTNIVGLDLTLREELGGYSSLTLQSEYIKRNKENNSSTDKQAGYYSELIYRYDNNYAGGIRYEAINKNETDLSAYSGIDVGNLERYSAMLEYKPFEFSRLRLEYSHDKSKVIAGERKNIDSLILELNIEAGAHGAHAY